MCVNILLSIILMVVSTYGFGWSDISDAFDDATGSIEDAINDVFGANGLQKLSDSVEDVSGDISSILSDVVAIQTFFDAIKDNVEEVLDNVETVFNREWYSIPTTTTDGSALYETIKTLSDATGIAFNDIPGVEGFCTYITNGGPIKPEWLNFLKAAAELFTQFITSNNRRLKSFKEFHKGRKIFRERRLQTNSKSCVEGYTVTNYTLCNYAEAVYTKGIWYDYVVKQPLKLDLTSDISDFVNIEGSIIGNDKTYTNGNLLAFFLLLKQIIDVNDGLIDITCKAVIDIADPLVTDCAAGLICAGVRNVFDYINKWFGYILDNADYHDALTAATQMQTVFDNRERIITNQKKIKNFVNSEFIDTKQLIKNKMYALTVTMNYQFNLTDKLIENEILELTIRMNDGFNNTKTLFVDEMSELTETMNVQFDDTDNLINNEFDILTIYLNGIFENMLNRLTIIDKLLRTPNGQRYGWNKQTFNAIGIHSISDDGINNNNVNNMVEITQTDLIIVGVIGIILFLLVIINQIIIMLNNIKTL